MVSTASAATRPPFGPTLAALTLGKATSNAALRWMSPFLPTLSRAFDASVGTLTGIMGAAELAGLSTTLTGGALDRGRQRTALDDCVERVREAVGSSDTIAECGFFGQQIDVPVTLAP